MLTTRDTKRSTFTRRFRLLKAYRVMMRVLLSYLGLKLAGWLRGPDWTERRRILVHRRNAMRVVQMILALKGLFIKVGQMVSILTNFLPEDFRKELEGLQDQIPPRPLDEIVGRIEDEFGRPPEALFASFDPTPLASASLAQVHRATLHDGREVAVKVQHLDIEEVARLDLRTIRHLLGVLGAVIRVKGMAAQYNQIQGMIQDELDFVKEAHHIEAIAANFAGQQRVSFPRVVHEYSSPRVLTTEYIDAIKITNLDALDAHGIDRRDLAERVVEAYCQMIFVDGLYHADPHPGNLLIRPDGGIVFIDFGAVARLSPGMKEGIPQFIGGLLRRDDEGIQRALRQMGFIAHDGQAETISGLIDLFHERFLADIDLTTWKLQDISSEAALEAKLEMLSDFRKLGISFRTLTSTFQVPSDVVLLERTVLLLMGLCTHLYPDMNPMDTIQPYLEAFVLGPDRDWKAALGAVVRDMARSALTIPNDMSRLLTRANRGELEMRVHGFRAGTRLLYALGHQFLYGLFSMVSGVLAYLTYLNSDLTLTRIALGFSGFFLLCMFASILLARKWQRER